MGSKTNYLENKLIDFLFRGQAFVPPATLYIALFTTAPDDASGGTEVTGGSYARASKAASLANFSGTQGAGTTTVSSGTSGTTSNNNDITYPAPTANWGSVVGMGIMDTATGGNMLYWSALTTPKTVNNGDAAPVFSAASLQISED